MNRSFEDFLATLPGKPTPPMEAHLRAAFEAGQAAAIARLAPKLRTAAIAARDQQAALATVADHSTRLTAALHGLTDEIAGKRAPTRH